MPKNYTVGQYVGSSKKDREEVAEIMKKNPLWSKRAARELLALRRHREAIRVAGAK